LNYLLCGFSLALTNSGLFYKSNGCLKFWTFFTIIQKLFLTHREYFYKLHTLKIIFLKKTLPYCFVFNMLENTSTSYAPLVFIRLAS